MSSIQKTNIWHDRQSLARPNYLNKLPRVELEIVRGRARNRLRPMRGTTFLIGTGKHCDLVLGDPQFEEVHGYLLLGPEGLVLRHLGFDPELTVDGRPVNNLVLWNQARIRTGPYEFRVHIRPVAECEGRRSQWGDCEAPAAEEASLRVYREVDDRRSGMARAADERAGVIRRRPPEWRHLSELILSS